MHNLNCEKGYAVGLICAWKGGVLRLKGDWIGMALRFFNYQGEGSSRVGTFELCLAGLRREKRKGKREEIGQALS